MDLITNKLLPRSLIDELPEPELKGLGLMVREIINSDIFEIDDDYTIHMMYHDVKISLHVLETVKTRINERKREVSCSVEFWSGHICISVPGNTPATDDCLIFMMLAKNHWRKDMVPSTLWKPIQRVLGLRTQKEEERKKAEQAELEKKLRAEQAELAHQRKLQQLRSTEKEDWAWILSHFTTEKGAMIPDYY